MVSQSVLLRGVNDDARTLEALMRAFVECRIKPYYLHHADLAPGTSHFRTSIAEGQALMRALARPRVGARAADLRARHPRRPRQGAGRAGLHRHVRRGGCGGRGYQRPQSTDIVARIERSEIRVRLASRSPAFAALQPGYRIRSPKFPVGSLMSPPQSTGEFLLAHIGETTSAAFDTPTSAAIRLRG